MFSPPKKKWLLKGLNFLPVFFCCIAGLENVTGLLVFTNLGALARLALNMWIPIINDWFGSPKMGSSAPFGVAVMMEELDGVRRSLRTVRLRHHTAWRIQESEWCWGKAIRIHCVWSYLYNGCLMSIDFPVWWNTMNKLWRALTRCIVCGTSSFMLSSRRELSHALGLPYVQT